MFYRIIYNITGAGHDRVFDDYWSSNSGANAFKKAVKETKEANPDLDIDNFYAFYILPCNKDGFVNGPWDKSKMHGWNGQLSYPN